MRNKFKIGDKVKFLRSNDFGVVESIISERKLKVRDSSGFISVVNINDIIIYDNSTNTVASYGDMKTGKDNYSNKNIKTKIVSNLNVLKLDLHIENLISDYQQMTNFEIVQVQVKKCEDFLLKSFNTNVQKLIIVHGIGEGVLKKEVHELLNRYQLRYYESLNGGSTEVMI